MVKAILFSDSRKKKALMKQSKMLKTCSRINGFLSRISMTSCLYTKVQIMISMFDYILIDNIWIVYQSPRLGLQIEKKLKELSNSVLWSKSEFYLRLMKQ